MLQSFVPLVKPTLFPGLTLNPAKNSAPPEMCWRTLAALFPIGVLPQLKTRWKRLVRIITLPGRPTCLRV